MGRRVFWFYGGDRTGSAYDIGVVAEKTALEACNAFGVSFPSAMVHDLSSPKILALLGDLTPGEVHWMEVQALPSAYDEFRDSHRGYDYRAMEGAGHDDPRF